MLGVAVADRQHVAVEVHGALRLAGGARGEADQADVVRGGVAGGEMLVARLLHHRFEAVVAALAPIDDALEIGRDRLGLLHLVGKPRVAQRQRDLALGDRIAQLLGAQQRHGRDHHRAGLHRGEIGRDHHRIVGGAQQHAIAGDQARDRASARWRCGSPARRAARRSAFPMARSGRAGRPRPPRPSGRAIW